MSVSSRSSSSSSSSSWSGKSGSRTSSSKWSTSTKSREHQLPDTASVNALVWFTGRHPGKVKGVKVYETLYERDYEADTRSNRSGFSTGTMRKKEYEVVFIETPRIRADYYSSNYSRGWKSSGSNGRSSRASGRKGSDPWAGRNGGHQHGGNNHLDDDDGSSTTSDDSEAEYGKPVPPPMHPGMPRPGGMGMGPGPGMGMGVPPPPPGWNRPMGGMAPPPPPGFRPIPSPSGFRPGAMGGPPGGPMPPPPPPEFIQVS